MANEVKVEITLETNDAQQAVKQFEKTLSGLSSDFKKAGRASDSFGKNVASSAKSAVSALEVFKGALAANLVADSFRLIKDAAVSAFSAITDSARSLEDLETRFRVLTGSAEEARIVLSDLRDFAARTPFELEGIGDAAATLLSFGFESNTLLDRLKVLGDVAAGSGRDFGELALIFGQVAAAGRLTGERLLQLQERSANLLPVLADQLGKTQQEVRALVSAGAIDFATFEQAFTSLTTEGGRFFQGTIQQSETLSGRLSTLRDNFRETTAAAGDQFVPALKDLTTASTEFLQQNRGIIVALSQETAPALNFVAEAVRGAGAAFTDFALRGLDPSTIEIVDKQIKQLNVDLIDLEQQLLRGGRVGGVFGGGAAISNEAKQIDQIKKQIEDLTTLRAQLAEKEAEEARKRGARTDEEVAQLNGLISLEERRTQQAIANEQQREEARKATAQESIDNQIAEEQLLNDTRLQGIADTIGREEAIREQAEINRLNREGNFTEARKRQIALREKAEQESFFRVEKFENLSQKQRVNNFKATLQTIGTLQQSNNKALFAIGKAAAISQATIDGIVAVQRALSSAPPPFNFVLAGLVGTATAVNIAKIASQQPPSGGGFQFGGIVPGQPSNADNQQIAVAGGELVLNRRQQANLFNQLNAPGAGNSGSLNINIESSVGGVSDEQIDNLVEAINTRTEFGNTALRTA